jgi:hypothetical protein
VVPGVRLNAVSANEIDQNMLVRQPFPGKVKFMAAIHILDERLILIRFATAKKC